MMETQDYIQWFIDNLNLTKFCRSAGWIFFAIGYSEIDLQWEAGYRDEGYEDYDDPCWCGPFGSGSTWVDAIKDAYEKYSKIAENLRNSLSNLRRPTHLKTDGKYRYVTIDDDGVNIENLVYINDEYDDHKFWRPNGDMLHVRERDYWWASIFEVAE